MRSPPAKQELPASKARLLSNISNTRNFCEIAKAAGVNNLCANGHKLLIFMTKSFEIEQVMRAKFNKNTIIRKK